MLKKFLYYILGSKKIAIATVIIFVGVVVFKELLVFYNLDRELLKDFKRENFDHVVINKYRDAYQHLYPVLILRDENGYEEKDEDSSLGRSYLFDYLSIGDTIKKQAGTNLN